MNPKRRGAEESTNIATTREVVERAIDLSKAIQGRWEDIASMVRQQVDHRTGCPKAVIPSGEDRAD